MRRSWTKSAMAKTRDRSRLRLELLESRTLLDSGLAHGMAASNLTDPTGGTDGVDHLSWSNPGAPATVTVFLHSHGGSGKITTAQRARIQAGIAELNRTWDGTLGLRIVEATSDAAAQIHLHNNSSSGCGGKGQGVLGCAEYYYYTAPSGTGADGHDVYSFVGNEFGSLYKPKVTLITGWKWYTGSSPGGISSSQFDYQTVVVQELAHAIGLDHDTGTYGTLNGDGHSAMYPYASFGHPHRALSDHDLASMRHLYAGGGDPGGSSGPTGGAATADDHEHDHGEGGGTNLPPPNDIEQRPVLSGVPTVSSATETRQALSQRPAVKLAVEITGQRMTTTTEQDPSFVPGVDSTSEFGNLRDANTHEGRVAGYVDSNGKATAPAPTNSFTSGQWEKALDACFTNESWHNNQPFGWSVASGLGAEEPGQRRESSALLGLFATALSLGQVLERKETKTSALNGVRRTIAS